MEPQRFSRDLQIAAFTALVQQMVVHPEKFEEFQGVLNDSAIALNINEAFATKMIQHQLSN